MSSTQALIGSTQRSGPVDQIATPPSKLRGQMRHRYADMWDCFQDVENPKRAGPGVSRSDGLWPLGRSMEDVLVVAVSAFKHRATATSHGACCRPEDGVRNRAIRICEPKSPQNRICLWIYRTRARPLGMVRNQDSACIRQRGINGTTQGERLPTSEDGSSDNTLS